VKELSELMGLANELKKRNYTVNIFNNKKLILRMGKEAKPGLLSAFGPIEIKDLRAILSLLG